MSVHRSALCLALMAIATTTYAADAPLTRSEVKNQTLMAICLGEETAVGDSGKTSREEWPEEYKKRRAMCNRWIDTMPAKARIAAPGTNPAPK